MFEELLLVAASDRVKFFGTLENILENKHLRSCENHCALWQIGTIIDVWQSCGYVSRIQNLKKHKLK